MRLRSLASLRPWLYPYNIEIIYIPISIIYYLVSYYGTVFLCINLLLTFTVIQPAAAKVINKQINQPNQPEICSIYLCTHEKVNGHTTGSMKVRAFLARVYVPGNESNTKDIVQNSKIDFKRNHDEVPGLFKRY